MTLRGRAIVTEPGVTITIAPAGEVIVLDLWAGTLPALGDVAVMQVEPQRWWLLGPVAALADITAALGENGAISPIGGGLMRASLTGSGWRAQLMISGLFDAEDPAFGPGHCAATRLHHAPIWIDVLSEDAASVYFPASLLGDIRHLWGV